MEPSKHKKNRILVFLEGGQLLKITENELLHYDLRPGADLPEETVEELKKSALERASQMKARGCPEVTGSRMLSKKQVVEHLTRQGGPLGRRRRTPPAGWRSWVRWTRRPTAPPLSGFTAPPATAPAHPPGAEPPGHPRDLWEELLSQMPPAEEAAERYLRARCRNKTVDEALLRKLSAALQRRGFSWQDIQAPLRRLESEIQE